MKLPLMAMTLFNVIDKKEMYRTEKETISFFYFITKKAGTLSFFITKTDIKGGEALSS